MIESLPLKDAKLLRLDRKHDSRGWFTETFRQEWLTQAGIDNKFIFEFWSHSEYQLTLRGMHAQTADAPQAKLVSVLNGGIIDILIDAREDSPTFGEHCTIQINKEDATVIYVPRGFYHGFVTLKPNTYVGYKLDNYHNGAAECGLYLNGADLDIPEALENIHFTMSPRDLSHPNWENCYKFKGNI